MEELVGVRRAKYQGSKGIKRAKGVRKVKGPYVEDKKDGGPSLFPHQIIDFEPVYFAIAPASVQLVF